MDPTGANANVPVFGSIYGEFAKLLAERREERQDDLMSATRYAIMMKRKAVTRPAPPRQTGGSWAPLDREVGY